jgi:uncharacterized membrane protein
VALATVALLFSPNLHFPGDSQTALIVVRWAHLVAGITWVGLLYFFNLVSLPLLQELDTNSRGIVVRKLMPRALWWFRWSAVVTVLAGLSYWMHIVASDARNAAAQGNPASAGMMFGSFFGLWTLAFVIEMGALMSPAEGLRKGPVLGAIMAVTLIAAAYIFVSLNQQGWESNQALAIGIGGGLGWFMLLNVWGVVWRMQKKLIRWTEANASQGTPMPPETPKMASIALLCTRLNFWVSFPMLFFMGASSHYIMFGGR